MRMTENKSKKHMNNIVSNLLVLNLFDIQTREGIVVSLHTWQISSGIIILR